MSKNKKLLAISILVAALSVISGVLYRLGGIGKPFKTWMRDWLIPPITYGLWIYLAHPVWYGWLLILLAIPLSGGALTTYWDKLFNDVDNFYLHGLMVGLGAAPLFFAGTHWYWILTRAIILAIFMGQVNYWANKKQWPFRDWIEEISRGVAIVCTVPLLIL